MRNRTVYLFGRAVTTNEKLLEMLPEVGPACVCERFEQLIPALAAAAPAVLVFAASGAEALDLQRIETVKRRVAAVEIILIDAPTGPDLRARAFAAGVCDAFPAAFDPALLVERIRALQRRIP